jgi:hypothetical protein
VRVGVKKMAHDVFPHNFTLRGLQVCFVDMCAVASALHALTWSDSVDWLQHMFRKVRLIGNEIN